MLTNFFRLAALGGLPLLSAAQTPTASRPFYVGVGASVLTHVVTRFYPYASTAAVVGPALTLGWQFTPQLSAQLGAAYHGQTRDENEVGFYTSRQRTRSLTAPLLLRYSFSPTPRRFHLDAVAGLTIRHVRFNYEETYTTSSGAPLYAAGTSTSTEVNLTLGPAVRYALTPQFELTALPLVNLALNKSYGDFKNRLFGNGQVGINYTFGH
jgi:hypothetical protein